MSVKPSPASRRQCRQPTSQQLNCPGNGADRIRIAGGRAGGGLLTAWHEITSVVAFEVMVVKPVELLPFQIRFALSRRITALVPMMAGDRRDVGVQLDEQKVHWVRGHEQWRENASEVTCTTRAGRTLPSESSKAQRSGGPRLTE